MISPSAYLYGETAAVVENSGRPHTARASLTPKGGPLTGFRMCATSHKEMNYRKERLGWKAYNYTDPFLPFQSKRPSRHVETIHPGSWFGAGHYNIRKSYWVMYSWLPMTGIIGGGLGYAVYMTKMMRNGWVLKNQGAVVGD